MDISDIDLNLLVTFDSLLRFRSVSRAAQALSTSQPSVSYALKRLKNLTVIDIGADIVEALAGVQQRGMRVNVLIQDGEVQWLGEGHSFTFRPVTRMASDEEAARA